MKHGTLVPDDLWEAIEPFLPVALAAEGAGLRQRLDLLATASRLAGDRRLGDAAHQARDLARRSVRHRLEPGEPGQL